MAGEQPVIRSEGVKRKGYLYIDDTVDAYLIAARAPEKNIIALNASSAESYNAREIVDTVKDVMGSEVETRIDGVGTNEEDEALSSSLIKSLGWEQKVSLGEGILKTVEGMKLAVPA
jgi:nucleoside-diphosphate-sugar epimerase